MNDIRDLLPGRMRERTFQLKARRDTGVAWHEPQFVECKQCGRRATRQIWAKSLFVCPNCGNHQPIGAYYRLSLVLDSGSFRELDEELAPQDVLGFPGYTDKLAAQTIDHKATRKEAKAIAAEAAKDLPEAEHAAFVTDTYQAIKGHLVLSQLAEVLIPAGREDLIAPIAAVYSI